MVYTNLAMRYTETVRYVQEKLWQRGFRTRNFESFTHVDFDVLVNRGDNEWKLIVFSEDKFAKDRLRNLKKDIVVAVVDGNKNILYYKSRGNHEWILEKSPLRIFE